MSERFYCAAQAHYCSESVCTFDPLTGKGCKHKVSKSMQKRLGKAWRKIVDEQNKN
jgi:hypothetical protein